MILTVAGLILLVIGVALWLVVTPAGFWLAVIGAVACAAGLVIDRHHPTP